jgi:hypothetical protein
MDKLKKYNIIEKLIKIRDNLCRTRDDKDLIAEVCNIIEEL